MSDFSVWPYAHTEKSDNFILGEKSTKTYGNEVRKSKLENMYQILMKKKGCALT